MINDLAAPINVIFKKKKDGRKPVLDQRATMHNNGNVWMPTQATTLQKREVRIRSTEDTEDASGVPTSFLPDTHSST